MISKKQMYDQQKNRCMISKKQMYDQQKTDV